MKPLLFFLCALTWSLVFGASVIEKRELPAGSSQQQTSQALSQVIQQPQQHQASGAYTSMYSAYGGDTSLAALDRQAAGSNYYPQPYMPYPQQQSYGPPVPAQYQPQYQQQEPAGYQQQGYQPQTQQYGGGGGSYSDPGFSMQTGFEGFLVPNPWYGLLPWGMEGGVVIAIAVIVFIVVKIALIFLFLKIFKIGRLFKDEEDEDVRSMSSYLPSFISRENFATLASSVFNAIDKYNELEDKED